MGPLQIYDPTENIVYVSHPEPPPMETTSDVCAYFEEVRRYWRTQVRRKAYYLIDWRGFALNIRESEAYGACVKRVGQECAITIVRFGENPLQRAVTRAVSVKQHVPSHIYDTKAEALAVIRDLKSGAITVAESRT
jgi:hypothetical protein